MHGIIVKILVKPYTWAILQEKQNVLTKTIRAMWRAL